MQAQHEGPGGQTRQPGTLVRSRSGHTPHWPRRSRENSEAGHSGSERMARCRQATWEHAHAAAALLLQARPPPKAARSPCLRVPRRTDPIAKAHPGNLICFIGAALATQLEEGRPHIPALHYLHAAHDCIAGTTGPAWCAHRRAAAEPHLHFAARSESRERNRSMVDEQDAKWGSTTDN